MTSTDSACLDPSAEMERPIEIVLREVREETGLADLRPRSDAELLQERLEDLWTHSG